MIVREGIDVGCGSCVNRRHYDPGYSVTGASSARRRDPAPTMLTAEDIARLTGAPLRTAQRRLADWRRNGGPVVRRPSDGRGQPPWAVPLDAYCARVGLAADDVLDALHPTGVAA